MLFSVVLDTRGIFEDRGWSRHYPGLRLSPENPRLRNVLSAGALQRHPGMEEASLLEDKGPALGKTDINCSPVVGP